ncbi:MAG: TetR/AcrR family transcriptional regulator [Deltaproteobacteria bacterium]|jgi:AcrR family transcriptional regulator|nr:TetR/AcrR family transcriptional regulator [Deltaproteobacteria bacterium]
MDMSDKLKALRPKMKSKTFPPGRVKIADALRHLLEKKEFNAITTAEISRQAGVTEALIYKYFKDKRDLLHQVLSEYLEQYCVLVQGDLKGIKGALNKLRKLIWSHINVYATSRVFAKILLIEARSHNDYYHSDTYELVKVYSGVILEILEEGISNGEIRDDIPVKLIRQIILGSIEQVCLTGITFDRSIDPDTLTDDICEIVFNGIIP